jgi:predicted transcriptional regulator
MSYLKAGSAEARFAELIWEREPISSGELAKLGAAEFGWKKTTSFTVLKRLCERGLFVNEGGVVRSLVPRAEFSARQSGQFVDEAFGGSLPAFLAAFCSGKRLSEAELDELEAIIEGMRGTAT